MTQTTPTPGQPLSEADVSLLKKGDLLLCPIWGVVQFDRFDDSKRRAFVLDLKNNQVRLMVPAKMTYLGRPDQDGPSDERWSPVIDGDDGYFVSDHGRFFGPKGQLKPFRNSRVGHTAIKMHPSKRTLLAHVAVARAFIGPRPEGTYVAHLNGIPDDNRRENLSYVSPAENSAHRRAHGTSMYAGRHPNAKFSDEDVRAIRALGPNASRRDLARQYGVHRGTIESIIAGRSWRQVDMTPAPGPHAPVSRPGDGVDSVADVLFLFREFVLRNATQWKMGAGHHHPMWRLIAETLGDRNDERIEDGPRWSFIQAENREALTPPAEPVSRPAGEERWTEDMERERREADYERGFRDGKEATRRPAGEGEREAVAWPVVTDQWAETYCELTGRDPDGRQVTFVDGGTVTTFRDMARREIEAMLCAAPKAAVRAIAAHQPGGER